MLYRCLKIIVRIAIKIFCRKIIINDRSLLKEKGPLLLACNHPNSFLDGVVLDTLFEQPVYSLARGDVFKKPRYARLLRSLRLLPVFRISEGAENLSANYDTFASCKEIFHQNGIVIIFSEGRCINEWHLRPLKKGTARLAIASWKENIPLRILPVGINYSSFRRFGKNIIIHVGQPIEKKNFDITLSDGLIYQSFNDILNAQLNQLVFEIDKKDKIKQRQLLEFKPSPIRKILLALPAVLGYIIHLPLYLPLKRLVFKRTDHNDHFDSVMNSVLLVTYPIYLLLIALAIFFFTGLAYAFLTLVIFPLLAWSYVQLKEQIDK